MLQTISKSYFSQLVCFVCFLLHFPPHNTLQKSAAADGLEQHNKNGAECDFSLPSSFQLLVFFCFMCPGSCFFFHRSPGSESNSSNHTHTHVHRPLSHTVPDAFNHHTTSAHFYAESCFAFFVSVFAHQPSMLHTTAAQQCNL